jgi:hypothetical protein
MDAKVHMNYIVHGEPRISIRWERDGGIVLSMTLLKKFKTLSKREMTNIFSEIINTTQTGLPVCWLYSASVLPVAHLCYTANEAHIQ